MIISIASGNGGTGKTTVATNLAVGAENILGIPCGLVINMLVEVMPESKERSKNLFP
jgi:CO dehydrogenase nickel-insertion accessory protein CooC1